MQATHLIFSTGERLFGDEARKLTAHLLDGVQAGLVSTTMNYEGEQSKTSFPHVQFVSAAKGFGLIGFGELGQAVLDDLAPYLHAALCQHYKRLISVERKELSLALEKRPYSLTYVVPKMIVQKKPVHLQWLEEPERGKEHLEQLFMRSLERQASATGITLPEGLSVTFMGAQDWFFFKNKAGAPALRGIKQAHFALNAKLTGLWAVGYQLGKGYGQFNANLQLGTGDN